MIKNRYNQIPQAAANPWHQEEEKNDKNQRLENK